MGANFSGAAGNGGGERSFKLGRAGMIVASNGADRCIHQDRSAACGTVVPVAAALLGLCAMVLTLLSTQRYGASLSPDSGGYLSAARSLLAGNGYVCWNGTVYSQWPPLFPTLLAGLGLCGADMAVGARILNAVAFGLIVFLAGRLFARVTTTRAFAIVGTLSVLVSIPILGVAVRLLSEPVFIVLVLLFLLSLPTFLRTGRLRSLIFISLLAALACLQRYAGVTTILAGALLIVVSMPGFSLRRGLAYSVSFGVLAGAPLAAWFVRNRLVAGRTAGYHHFHLFSAEEIRQTLMPASRLVSTWLFSESFARTAMWLGPAVIAGMVILAAIVWQRRASDPADARRLQLRCVAVYAVVYFAFLVVFAAGLGWPAEPRLLAPMYVPFMVLVVVVLEDVCQSLGRLVRGVPVVQTLGILLCVAWLLGRVPLVRRNVVAYMQDGTGGYCTAIWQESALVTWLRQHPPEGKLYSNIPEAVYLLTGTIAEPTPQGDTDLAEFAKKMSRQASYVAWFHEDYPDTFLDLPEFLSRCDLTEMVDLPDGKLYRGSGAVRAEPWVQAVYRLWLPSLRRHCYAGRQQRDELLQGTDGWISETTAFYALAERQPGTSPVYHLWSQDKQADFYTVDEAEKDNLLHATPNAWTLRDIAFYAYREQSAKGLSPVYRLRSRKSGDCLLTTDAQERARLMYDGASEWINQGVVWYAYEP